MASKQRVADNIILSVIACTKRHFGTALGLVISSETVTCGDIESLGLRDLTSIIGLGGPISLLIAFSFDTRLATYLFEIETAAICIPEQERQLYMRETTAETINIVLGHATADLAGAGNMLVLSAPVVIAEGGRLHRPKGAFFTRMTLQTAHGVLDVDFITPRHLFGDDLHAATL
jgi:CheY-specific phosphatase CheX